MDEVEVMDTGREIASHAMAAAAHTSPSTSTDIGDGEPSIQTDDPEISLSLSGRFNYPKSL